jgi:hypothetical protein
MTWIFLGGRYGRMLAAAVALGLAGTVAVLAAPRHMQTADDGWTTYKSDEFGYSLYYPSAYFQPQGIAAPGEPKSFLSPDGKAKLVVSGADNDENFTLAAYRATILNDFGGYDRLDYSPKGQSWFVLSGYRGDNIYYQKVIFSCRGRIINALSITFPADEKPRYEGLIEVIEDGFRPGRGADTPTRCTS